MLEGESIVSVAAGYVHWVALGADGAVFTCATGSDGYAGLLQSTNATGGFRTPNLEGELGWPTPQTPDGVMPGVCRVSDGSMALTWGAMCFLGCELNVVVPESEPLHNVCALLERVQVALSIRVGAFLHQLVILHL